MITVVVTTLYLNQKASKLSRTANTDPPNASRTILENVRFAIVQWLSPFLTSFTEMALPSFRFAAKLPSSVRARTGGGTDECVALALPVFKEPNQRRPCVAWRLLSPQLANSGHKFVIAVCGVPRHAAGAAVFRPMMRPTSWRLAPSANKDRTSNSIETVASAASIFATRD